MSGPLTIGTAGHVDHGKTALVAALTGRDTDRLAEEKRRGISIELGFAELDLGDRRLSLVDVPGHEKFLRTMVAGASGIDTYLLVVAADDGVMPQTLEHVRVLHALGVERGVVALTKCDLTGPNARERAAREVAALAPGSPIVEVSARTGAGIPALRETLRRTVADISRRPEPDAAPVLHVDRVFTVAGHGTVVTGTLWSGRLRRGETVVLLPSRQEGRVRSIEVHDRRLEAADAHQRVALNLSGIGRDRVSRGEVVTTREAEVADTYRLDVRLTVGAERIRERRRVQVHLGTRDVAARVVNRGGEEVQLRLEQPLLARRADRFVVRSIAPPDTLGGGVVIGPSPPRRGDSASRADPPASPGQNGGQDLAVLARHLLFELRDDGPRPRTPAVLAEAVGSSPRQVEQALAHLVATGEAVRARRDVVYPAAEYARLREQVLILARRGGETTIAEVRDELGLSRKYAQALLERLGAERALRRVDDRHLLWRAT